MELRSYGAILWRRLWVIALVFGVVALYAAYQYYGLLKTPGALKAYQSNVTMRIGLQATPSSSDQYYADYQSTSEALADEFVTGPQLNSQDFGNQVLHQLQNDIQNGRATGLTADQDISAISNALSATRTHALVTISATWSTPAGAKAIATAVGEVCKAQIGNYLDYEVRQGTSLYQTAHPQVAAEITSAASDAALAAGPEASKPTLLLILLLFALIVGGALAFLIDYLDDRLRSREEIVQLLQLPVYGEIPRVP